ncbi:GNAT family N-acetyltransferase [Longispora sp. NPDC051575]|uniref:GNAT family N-acetyltransferase n=1 Tax=Longispora sp. NPDC051575 TaxID=3154943 RepID=UPI0034155136
MDNGAASMFVGAAAGVVVRAATEADLDGLVASTAGLFAEDAATRDGLRNADWPQAHARAYEEGNLADPDVLVLVADHEGTIVGHLTGTFHAASPMWTAPKAHLVSLHVAAPWRGHDIGTRLVAEFRSWAAEKGAVQLRVSAYAANTAAIRFYQRHGFTPLETTLAVDL